MSRIEDPRGRSTGNLQLFSNLEIIFRVFPAENNFVDAPIPLIGGKKKF